MKGKLIPTKDGLALKLTPKDNTEKKWLLNAFHQVSAGVLTSTEGDIESLMLWTSTNYELPVKNNPKEEGKTE